MQSLTLKDYNLLNPIGNKMQQIIDCFVEFFGEKYREKITQKLQSSICLFLPKSENNYEELIKTLESINKKERNKLIENFYGEIGYNYQKVSNRAFAPEFALILKNKIESGDISDSDYKMLAEILFCKFNVPYGKNGKELVDSWLMSAKDKRKIIDFLNDVNVKWRTSPHKEKLIAIGTECQNIISSVNKIVEFNANENAQAEREIANLILNKFSQIKNVSVSELLKEPQIDFYINQMKKIAFNSRTNFLNDSWFDTESYKDIKLYNFLGFNHGFDYNNYLDDSKLLDVVLSNEFIGEIQSVAATHSEKIIKNDLFLNNAFERVNKLKFYCNRGYVLKEIVDFSTKTTGGIASTLNVFDNKRQLINVCIFDSPLICGDDTLIHELCHVCSSFGEITKELLATIYCGVSKIQVQDTDTNDFSYEDLYSDYTFETKSSKALMLNEVLTDYFSYKILDIFKSKNLQVCKGKNDLSYYAWMFGMMQDLIEDNIDIFKIAYLEGDISALTKIMPKKDIKLLSDSLEKIFVTYSEISFKRFEKEIKEKTGLKENVLYEVKQYIDKDLGWSNEIKEFFEYYKKIDKIAEKIKNNPEKLKKIDKNK